MKKILILLTLFTAFLVADDGFQILVNTPEEVDSMSAILNGLAMLFKNEGYLTLLKFIFVIGSFVILFNWALSSSEEGAAKKGLGTYLKYNMGVVAILTIAFSSVQTSMWVKSKTFPSLFSESTSETTGIKVDNIPYVVAVGIYGLNHFGESLTELYQQAMSPIGNYSLNRDGYASSLRDSLDLLTLDLGNTDQKLGDAIDVLVSQCVYIPFSSKMGGEGYIEELRRSKNLKATFDHWYNDDVEVGGIKAKDYTASFMGKEWKCGDLWQYVKDSLSDFNDKAEASLNRIDSRDIAMITGLHSGISASNFDEIALQSGIVNSVLNNKDIGSGISYAAGKSQAEFIQENIGAGYYMAKMLPVMQTIFRALIYALFPAILAISLLPGGWLILKNYIKTAVWIELWGVISAILNFFISKYGEKILSANGDASHHTVSSYSVVHMVDNASSLAGVAGYLYLMVPGIAWGLMSGSFNMLEGIGRGLGGGITKNMSTDMMARDQKKLSMKEAASAQAGEDLSYAEAMHFEQVAAGMKEGTEVGVLKNQGLANVANMASYNATKPFAELRRKEAFAKAMGKVGGGGGIAELEANSAAMSLAKNTGSYDAGKGDANTFHTLGEASVIKPLAEVNAVGLEGIATNAAGSALEQNGRINQIGLGNMKNIGAMKGEKERSEFEAIGISGAGFISKQNALRSLGQAKGLGGSAFSVGLADGLSNVAKMEGYGGPGGMAKAANINARIDKGKTDAIGSSAYHVGAVDGSAKAGAASVQTTDQAREVAATKATIDKEHYLNEKDPEGVGKFMAAKDNANAQKIAEHGMDNVQQQDFLSYEKSFNSTFGEFNAIGGDMGAWAAYGFKTGSSSAIESLKNAETTAKTVEAFGGSENYIDKGSDARAYSNISDISKENSTASTAIKAVGDELNSLSDMASITARKLGVDDTTAKLALFDSLRKQGIHSKDLTEGIIRGLAEKTEEFKAVNETYEKEHNGHSYSRDLEAYNKLSNNIARQEEILSRTNSPHKKIAIESQIKTQKEALKEIESNISSFEEQHGSLIQSLENKTESIVRGLNDQYGILDNNGNLKDTQSYLNDPNISERERKNLASQIVGTLQGNKAEFVGVEGDDMRRTYDIAGQLAQKLSKWAAGAQYNIHTGGGASYLNMKGVLSTESAMVTAGIGNVAKNITQGFLFKKILK